MTANSIKRVLVTDCGSTTTKAVLFEQKADRWRQTFRGEAPTTVEKPVSDVTIGVLNAFKEVQDISGINILSEQSNNGYLIRSSIESDDGIDLYLSTSSAGGGLQMITLGVVSDISALSAEKAALGAGAIVLKNFHFDDGIEISEKIKLIQHLKPDIILVAGGTEGGTKNHPLELLEMILQANPKPRFGESLKTPVIYCGNSDIYNDATNLLSTNFDLSLIPNIRPEINIEVLSEARDAVHDLFLHHVMSHAPGYEKLINMTPEPILPTPSAFGEMVKTASIMLKKNILAVDIGGATTDLFTSIIDNEGTITNYHRSVSANIGMSYSVTNVLLEVGESNIARWLPFSIKEGYVSDQLRNKMIRPTSIPAKKNDLLIEQAVCREALRLSFNHHKKLAQGDTKDKVNKLESIFAKSEEPLSISNFDFIIGSGGVLSHAPDRISSALMLLDGFQPTGIVDLAVDSIFMMPHLGVFSKINPQAATEVFLNDCIIRIATAIIPEGKFIADEKILKVSIEDKVYEISGGDLLAIPIKVETKVDLEILKKSVKIGSENKKLLSLTVLPSEAGLIIDCRGRDIKFGKNVEETLQLQQKWHNQLNLEY